MSDRVVIIGGGISGLTAAHMLHREGVALTLLEARNRLGGVILTEKIDGFLLDGGPDSFLARKPEALELCGELGLDRDLLPASDLRHRVRILLGGRLERLPDSFLLGLPGDLRSLFSADLLSLPGKIRLALERLVPVRRDGMEETVRQFFERRLGREAYVRIAEPLLGGIHAGDTEALSLPATFPDLAAMERDHGSLLRGLRARSRAEGEPGKKRPVGFVTLEGGMGDLVRSLADSIRDADVRLGVGVREVEGDRPPYRIILTDGDSVEASAVVLATPAHAAAELLASSHSALARGLADIPYVSTAVVFLAFPQASFPRPPEGYGFLVPRGEGRKIIACTFVSMKFPGRAPDGHVLLRAFVGGALREDIASLPDEELRALVRQELQGILGLEGDPIWGRVYRWEKSIPQYNLGHLDRIAAIERHLEGAPGLVLAGGAYNGSGIPDCIRSGRRAAANVIAAL